MYQISFDLIDYTAYCCVKHFLLRLPSCTYGNTIILQSCLLYVINNEEGLSPQAAFLLLCLCISESHTNAYPATLSHPCLACKVVNNLCFCFCQFYSLALQIKSFKQPRVLPTLLMDFISQYCFKLPKENKCRHRKRFETQIRIFVIISDNFWLEIYRSDVVAQLVFMQKMNRLCSVSYIVMCLFF